MALDSVRLILFETHLNEPSKRHVQHCKLGKHPCQLEALCSQQLYILLSAALRTFSYDSTIWCPRCRSIEIDTTVHQLERQPCKQLGIQDALFNLGVKVGICACFICPFVTCQLCLIVSAMTCISRVDLLQHTFLNRDLIQETAGQRTHTHRHTHTHQATIKISAAGTRGVSVCRRAVSRSPCLSQSTYSCSGRQTCKAP